MFIFSLIPKLYFLHAQGLTRPGPRARQIHTEVLTSAAHMGLESPDRITTINKKKDRVFTVTSCYGAYHGNALFSTYSQTLNVKDPEIAWVNF